MARIRRTKGGATFYAVTADDRGLITRWSPNPDDATDFSDEVSRKVRDFSANRPMLGKLDIAPPVADKPADPDAAKALSAVAKDRDQLKKVLADAEAEIELLRADNQRLTDAAKAIAEPKK